MAPKKGRKGGFPGFCLTPTGSPQNILGGFSYVPSYRLTGVIHRLWPSPAFGSAKESVNNSADSFKFNPGLATNMSLKCAPTLKSQGFAPGRGSVMKITHTQVPTLNTSRSIRPAAFIDHLP